MTAAWARSSGFSSICPTFTENNKTNIKTPPEYFHCCLCEAHLSVKTFPPKMANQTHNKDRKSKPTALVRQTGSQKEWLWFFFLIIFVNISFMKEKIHWIPHSADLYGYSLASQREDLAWALKNVLLGSLGIITTSSTTSEMDEVNPPRTLQSQCQSTGVLRARHQKTKQGKSFSRFHLRKWDQLRIWCSPRQ